MAQAAQGGGILLLDPGCDSIAGHHFSYDAALRAFCSARGIPIRVVGPVVRPAVMERLEGPAHFRTNVYVRQAGAIEVLAAAAQGNRFFLEDLEKLGEPAAGTTVMMHTVTHLHLVGLAAWLRKLREKPRVRLTLRYPPDFYASGDGGSVAGGLYLHALRTIAKAVPDARFYSDTAALAERYARASGVPVSLLPNPSSFLGPPPGEAPVREGPSRYLFLGEARFEKGYHLVPEAIRLALARRPGLRFVVQVTRGTPELDGELRKMAAGGAVTFATGLPVPDEAYVPMVRAADALLLPYRPDHYKLRASALFVDAIANGRCPIVTGGDTSMERELKEFQPLPGVLMSAFTAPALADAIVEFDTRRAELLAAVARAAPAIRARHGIERYYAVQCEAAA